MTIITVFRDPGWSLDVVTNMPKILWTQSYIDMIEQADTIKDDKYVMYLNHDDTVGSPALQALRDELVPKSSCQCTYPFSIQSLDRY